ncbi:hypothetical protein PthstB1num2_19240 [Parageobacillus thermoglucosidasius]|nr:hypothetical protein PthstB1num2_19240 [Parageobacillus thermoglucosidasius]
MQQTTPETVRHVFIPMEQHLTEEASAKNPTVFYACGRNHMQNRKGLRTIFLTEIEMLRARRQSIRASKNDGVYTVSQEKSKSLSPMKFREKALHCLFSKQVMGALCVLLSYGASPSSGKLWPAAAHQFNLYSRQIQGNGSRWQRYGNDSQVRAEQIPLSPVLS